VEKIGYGETKRLAAERFCRGDIHGLGRWIGIDGLGKSGRGAHPVATFPLRCAWHIAIEARHSRDDDLFAIRLVHAVANPTSKRHAQGPE
jgi:hypothetical protein